MTEDETGKQIVDVTAVQIHLEPGPGLLETVYAPIRSNFCFLRVLGGLARTAYLSAKFWWTRFLCPHELRQIANHSWLSLCYT